jgi:hypothetical protein
MAEEFRRQNAWALSVAKGRARSARFANNLGLLTGVAGNLFAYGQAEGWGKGPGTTPFAAEGFAAPSSVQLTTLGPNAGGFNFSSPGSSVSGSYFPPTGFGLSLRSPF